MTLLLKQLQLACDYDRKKVKPPYLVQPKFDGVRGCNLWGRALARSLRPFDNRFTVSFFSHQAFLGFDGELAAGPEDSPSLCRDTTSALNTHGGEPWLMWHIFDYLTPETLALPYKERYVALKERVAWVQYHYPSCGAHLQVMPAVWCDDWEEVECCVEEHLDKGYEGTILRGPDEPHKNGRSTVNQNGILRIKPFIEVDAIISRIYEGQSNGNEAKLNLLGLTERSTHKENMVPNGMVGAVDAVLCEDAKHPGSGAVIHKAGETIRFGAGRMTHEDRLRYFKNPGLLIAQRMKGQIFPHGVKDKPRFPTFQALRMQADTVSC